MFSSRTVALYIDNASIVAAEGRVGDAPSFSLTQKWNWSEKVDFASRAEEAGAELKQELKERGFSASSLTIAIPRRHASCYRVELPGKSDSELVDLAWMHMEGVAGSSPEDTALDFIRLGDTTDGLTEVLIVTTPKPVCDWLRQLANAAGRKLIGLTLSDLACSQWIGTTPLAPSAMVACFQNRTEFAILRQGRIAHSHTTFHPQGASLKPVLGGLKQLLSTGGEEMEDGPIAVIGQPIRGEELVAAIEQQFARTSCCLSQQEIASGVSADLEPAELAACYGAAVQDGTSREAGVNLAAPKRVQRLGYRYYAIAAAAIALVAAGLALAWTEHRENLASLDRRIVQLRQMELAIRTRLDDQRHVLKDATAVRQWNERDTAWLDVLQTLQPYFPKDQRVYVSMLQFETSRNEEAPRLRVAGYSKSPSDVAALNADLLQLAPRFEILPHEIRPNTTDKQYRARFEFEIRIHSRDLSHPAPVDSAAENAASI